MKITKIAIFMCMMIFISGVQSQTREEIRAAFQSKDFNTAFTGSLKLAEQGDGAAQAQVASMYRGGQGTTKNERAGFEWAKKSAEQGNSQGQYILGICYMQGQGVQKDESLSVYWYTKALEGGNQFVHANLAIMYRRGLGVPKNYQKAIELLKKGVANNQLGSYNELANMYEKGEGVEVDLTESLRLLHIIKLRPNLDNLFATYIQASIDRINQKISITLQSSPSTPLQAPSSSTVALSTNSKSVLALEDPRRECEGRLEKDVRLSSIAPKMSLSGPSDIGFTMLAELSTPDAVEQKAIALFADNIRRCIKEAESFRQQKYSKEMNTVLSQFDSDFTDMTIELYNKKITYGKFNTKLQQSDKELNDRLGKIVNQISVQKNEQDEANKARADAMRDAQRRQDQARAAEEQRLQQQRQAEQDRIVASRNRWAARCNLDKANALAQSKVRNSQECDRIYANASDTTINRIGAAACVWSINDKAESYAKVTFDACMSGAP